MPNSKTLSGALAITSSSCSRPTVANTGRMWLQLGVGVVVCATTQIEQELDSVWFGWL